MVRVEAMTSIAILKRKFFIIVILVRLKKETRKITSIKCG